MSPRPRRLARPLAAALLTLTAGTVAIVPATPASAHTEIPASDFQKVSLASGGGEMGEAMSLAVLPDRSVVHTARDGTVRVTNAAGDTKVAGKLDVYSHDEEGLQGVAADPGFATNRYVWLYYSPKLTTPTTDAPKSGEATEWEKWKGHLNLSRFTLKADNTLDMASEKVVLEVDNDRGQCCHVGGDIDFDAQGNLYLTTGDDTNPFESSSYSPLDERTDRNPQFDAQRSSGNTNDLRGKLLRIHPEADGTYKIPDGNLFPPGTAKTRPEIYGMGFRNPFRMSVDKKTGIVYLGDYGPDAGGADPNRGPGGQVEFDRITGPGNFGWPYCTGTNTTTETYNEYTFPSGPSGAKYDCAGGPTNNSFRNTGLDKLPPAKPSWIKYGDQGSPPEFGSGSESPMGGPVYRFDAGLKSDIKFPAYLDGRYFAGELGRKWIKAIEVKQDGSPGEISAFPWTGTQVMDMAFGPDGALYVLDYGTGSNNQALYRIEYTGAGNHSPVAKAAADKTSGHSPLAVRFSSEGSSDMEPGPLTYSWDFGDGATSTDANPTHTYTKDGTFTAKLTVSDGDGASGTANVTITVGNTAPTVTFSSPTDGGLFSFGGTVPFEVKVTDPEDSSINCDKVKVTYSLGHDDHHHEITSKNGCTGSITTPADGEHDPAANLYGVLDAEYTDSGGLTTKDTRILQPRHRQAEHFSNMNGIQLAPHGPAEGGKTVGYTDDGDWISFNRYGLGGATKLTTRISSGGPGGTLEVRTGSATGPLLGSIPVSNTGGWENFVDLSADLTGVPAGTTTLVLVFKGPSGKGALFDLDSFTFTTGEPPTGDQIMLFTKTAAFRHDSIPAGIKAVKDLAEGGGYTVTATEDPSAFTAANLAKYKAVVFLSTTGDVLDDTQQAAFQAYIDGGGGYVGVHAASDTEYSWPYYGKLVGAWFKGHPAIQQATVKNEDRTHPATAHLDPTWTRTDEWYNFRTNPRANVHVLQSLDEGSYTGGDMGDHPITWCQQMSKGRSFYTGLGHTNESYSDDKFRKLLVGGIRYAMGAVQGNCGTDAGAPKVSATTTPAAPNGANGWFTSSVSVTVTAEDPSGIAKTQVSVDGEAWTDYTEPVSLASDGDHKVAYRATDKAGNTAEGAVQVKKDATTPLTTAKFAPANDDGWHGGAVPVTLASTDATSGVSAIEHSLDGGAWKPYTEPVNISGDGTHTLAYRAKDKAGNTETEKAATVKIDGTRPTILISGISDDQIYGDSQDLRIGWQATDGTSGVKTLTGELDSKPRQSGLLLPLYEMSLQTHELKVTATDKANNTTTQTVTFGVTTSTRDLSNLIDRFAATGRLSQKAADKLHDRLKRAGKDEASSDAKILKALKRFRSTATDPKLVTEEEFRQVFARDTDHLIADLS